LKNLSSLRMIQEDSSQKKRKKIPNPDFDIFILEEIKRGK